VASSPRPLLLVVNGGPATGKSWLAGQLGREFGATVISKDAIKERLHDSLGVEGTDALAWSRRLGAAAFALMFDEAERVLASGGSAAIEAPFDREQSSRIVRSLAERTASAIVQVVLRTLAERLEHDRDPLDIDGPTITIDTTDFAAVNVERIAEELRAALGESQRC
jgi:predicted kinase